MMLKVLCCTRNVAYLTAVVMPGSIDIYITFCFFANSWSTRFFSVKLLHLYWDWGQNDFVTFNVTSQVTRYPNSSHETISEGDKMLYLLCKVSSAFLCLSLFIWILLFKNRSITSSGRIFELRIKKRIWAFNNMWICFMVTFFLRVRCFCRFWNGLFNTDKI